MPSSLTSFWSALGLVAFSFAACAEVLDIPDKEEVVERPQGGAAGRPDSGAAGAGRAGGAGAGGASGAAGASGASGAGGAGGADPDDDDDDP
jgi:hypothetical protein